MKPLLKKPAGASKLHWNNTGAGTIGPVICELCGTKWPEDDGDSYALINFLGYQIVGKCCGRVLDIIYQESSEEFMVFFLKAFAEDPSNPKFYMFLNEYLPKSFKNKVSPQRVNRHYKGGHASAMASIFFAQRWVSGLDSSQA